MPSGRAAWREAAAPEEGWRAFPSQVPIRLGHLQKIDLGRAIIIIAIILFFPKTAASKFVSFWIEKKKKPKNKMMSLF